MPASWNSLPESPRGALRGAWISFWLAGLILGGGLPALSWAQGLGVAPAFSEDEDAKPLPPGYDRYDARAADEPDRSEQYRQVIKSAERQRWDDYAVGLQALLDSREDSLFRGEDQTWRPLWLAALQQLMTLPEEARSAYVDRFGALAEQSLANAEKANDWATRFRLARGFLATPAGQSATRQIIELAIDQGDTDCVALRAGDLLLVRSGQLQDAVWRSKLRTFLLRQRRTTLVQQLDEFAGEVIPTEPLPEVTQITAPVISDWTTVSGHPTGYSQSRIDAPLLIPRWRYSLAPVPAIREVYTRIAQQLPKDYGTPFRPICGLVTSQGVIVARTPTGLVSLEGTTGRVLWQVDSLVRHEQDHEGTTEPEDDGDFLARGNLSRVYDERQDVLLDRLTSQGIHSTLSTDGKRVMEVVPWHTVSRDTAGVLWIATGGQDDERTQNVLFARNLKTGRIEWSAGGPESEDIVGRPAAGTYFFGPPTPDGNELFAIGERRGDIHLYCLQADTGEVLWKQLLASPAVNVYQDYVRSQWLAVPSVRGGLVVCPTTTGWLITVDRQTRRIRWASRLRDRIASTDEDRHFNNGREENRDYGINRRFAPSQPVLIGNRVLIAPMELPDERGEQNATIMGFDLETGHRLWGLSGLNDTTPGIVGVTENLAVTGADALYPVPLDVGTLGDELFREGEPRGTHHLPPPLVTTQGLLVPTQQNHLHAISFHEGQFSPPAAVGLTMPQNLSRWERIIDPVHQSTLHMGQLVTLNGSLISASPWEIIAWEKQSDRDRWEEQATRDPRAALRHAQALTAEGKLEAARAVLLRAASLPDLGSDAEPIHDVRVSVLLELVERQLEATPSAPSDDTLWSELNELATRETDRETLQALTIERELLHGRWNAAWELTRSAIHKPWKQSIVRHEIQYSPEVWLRQIVRRLAQAPLPERTTLRTAIQSEFETLWAGAGDQAQRDRLQLIFGDLPGSDALELALVLNPEFPTPRIARLEALSQSLDPETARNAQLALIGQLIEAGWIGEALRKIERLPLAADWPVDRKSDLDSLAARVAAAPRTPLAPSWANQPVTLLRKREASDPYFANLTVRRGPRVYETPAWTYSYDEDRPALVIRQSDGTIYCTLALATNELNDEDESAPVVTIQGPLCFARHMSFLHAFSLPEKRELWRRKLTTSPNHEIDDEPAHRFVPVSQISGLVWNPSMGEILGFGDRQLVVHTQEGLSVLDACTGQTLWSNSVPEAESSFCSDGYLLFRHENAVGCWSLTHGLPQTAPDLQDEEFAIQEEVLQGFDSPGILTLKRSVTEMATDQFRIERRGLQASRITESPASNARWDQTDVLELTTVWSLPVSESATLSEGPPGTRLLLNPDRTLQSIHLATGQQRSLGSVPESLVPKNADESGTTLLAQIDHQFVYLFHEANGSDLSDYAGYEPAEGLLCAIPLRPDSSTGWTATLNGTVDPRITAAPFLPEYRRETLTMGGIAMERLHIALRDKSTGQPIHEFHLPRKQGSVYGVFFHPALQRLSINTESELIRIERQRPAPPAPLVP